MLSRETSVRHLSGVPLRFGFLPPLGQEGLLVVSHSLKLAVRVFCLGAVHFFWTHHVLKVNTEHSLSAESNHFTVLLPLHLAALKNPSPCAPCNSASARPLRSRQCVEMGGADLSQINAAPPQWPTPPSHIPHASLHPYICATLKLYTPFWNTLIYSFTTGWARLCEPSERVTFTGTCFRSSAALGVVWSRRRFGAVCL